MTKTCIGLRWDRRQGAGEILLGGVRKRRERQAMARYMIVTVGAKATASSPLRILRRKQRAVCTAHANANSSSSARCSVQPYGSAVHEPERHQVQHIVNCLLIGTPPATFAITGSRSRSNARERVNIVTTAHGSGFCIDGQTQESNRCGHGRG